MTLKTFILLLLTVTTSFAMAKGKRHKKNSKPEVPYKYYYTLPVDASAEWTYAIPECVSMSKDDYKLLTKKDNCKSNEENKSEACLSLADIELRNSKTNEKKNFGLNYIIYDTMKNCQDAREKLVPPAPAEEDAKTDKT